MRLLEAVPRQAIVANVIESGIVEGVIQRYIEHMRVRNLRPWTVYNRQCALARLRKWAGSPVLYLTEDDLKRWQTQRSREIQPECLRTEMSHQRQFYRWCVREGFRQDDPTLRMDLPRVARRLPRPISDEHLIEAMAQAPADIRVCLALAAFAGLRACEIARLDWSEISTGNNANIRVVEGKGGHGRIIPLSTALAGELDALPHRRGPVMRRRDGYPGQNTAHRISMLVNTYLHRIGLTETLHQSRHRFATSTYQACRDILAVQSLMGHASPTTTSQYAAAASDVSITAVEAAGSLAA